MSIPYRPCVPQAIRDTAALTYAAWCQMPASAASGDGKILHLYRQHIWRGIDRTPDQNEALWRRYMRLKCRLLEILDTHAAFKFLTPQDRSSSIVREVECLMLRLFERLATKQTQHAGQFTTCHACYSYISYPYRDHQPLFLLFLDKLDCASDANSKMQKRSVRIALLLQQFKLVVVRSSDRTGDRAAHINSKWYESLKNCPQVVPLKQILKLPEGPIAKQVGGTQHQLFKYYDAGDLSSLLEYEFFQVATPVNLKIRLQVVEDILHALASLHAIKAVHRDIKLQNIVVKRMHEGIRAGLIDFEFTCHLEAAEDAEQRQQFCGSMHYLAPERIECLVHNQPETTWNPASDMWSFGLVCLEMFKDSLPEDLLHWIEVGQKMIDDREFEKAHHMYADSVLHEQLKITTQEPLASFVWALLNPNPYTRLTAQQALSYLQEHLFSAN